MTVVVPTLYGAKLAGVLDNPRLITILLTVIPTPGFKIVFQLVTRADVLTVPVRDGVCCHVTVTVIFFLFACMG